MKYANGYQDKIDYYRYRINRAIDGLESDKVQYYAQRLAYFMERQRQLNRKAMGFCDKPQTIAGVTFPAFPSLYSDK